MLQRRRGRDGAPDRADKKDRREHRRAALLHRLVDVLGDESTRYLAQDTEDRAED
ncbi:hypothetical protein [Streptomyces sp. NPDC031705]|uniref:hypothetical protein n=1 Tax=Streptomyces sp. NPDC031705 TaxID=3155729 RepID=UPI00340054D3